MNTSAENARREDNVPYGSFLRAKSMSMALDLASAVATRLSAGWLDAHSLDVLFKYDSGSHGSACPSRNAIMRFRDEPFMNNAG